MRLLALFASGVALLALLVLGLGLQGAARLRAEGVSLGSVGIRGLRRVVLRDVGLSRGGRHVEIEALVVEASPAALLFGGGALRGVRLEGVRISEGEGPGPEGPSAAPAGEVETAERSVEARLSEGLSALERGELRMYAEGAALRSRLSPHLGGDLRVEVEGIALGAGAIVPLRAEGVIPLDPQRPISGSFTLGEAKEGGEASLDLRRRRWRLRLPPLRLPAELLASAMPEGVEARALTVDLDMTGSPGRVEGRGTLAFEALRVHSASLAAVPIGPLEGDVGAGWILDRVGGSVEILDLALRVGDVTWVGEGRWARSGEVAGRLALAPGARAEDLMAATPPDLVPALRGLEVEGPLALGVYVEGRLGPPADLTLTLSGDARGVLLHEGHVDTVPGPYPLEGRVYAPEDPQGRVHMRVLSRRAPGWVPLERIPTALSAAVIASEDGQFYNHRGVDPEAIESAFRDNLAAGEVVRGGSTLTQQLAKNLYLIPSRTLARKIQEAVLAWELERRMSKGQILETYLNIIEWGPGIYGIGAASERYFGVEPWALSTKQSVFLATIIPAPRRYYGYYLKGALTPVWEARVGDLLDLLARLGHISFAEASRAMAAPIGFAPRRSEGAPPEGGQGAGWEEPELGE